ncbi:MAG: sugar ABC transporter permease [Defluviitaleaceae bacterium]|nr:sugar ABC transporter permease [Defluviitaleaceae bacterium]
MDKAAKPATRGMTMAGKNAVSGYLFIAPFIIGFISFMAYPLYQTVRMSVSDVRLDLENNGFSMELLPSVRNVEDESFLAALFSNFRRAFFEDAEFTRAIVEELGSMLLLVPAIVIFSLFIAVLLNRKFFGRGFVRAVFFLPVILASGVLVGIESNNAMLIAVQQQIQDQNAMQAGVTGVIEDMLDNMVGGAGIGDFLEYILDIINQIYTIAMASGIQILIFLAGLQTINPSIYEAASIEGATGWENFWKITFPMISPMILVVVVYSVIDFMVRTDGEVMEMVEFAMQLNEFGFSSAMAISFFFIIAAILGVAGFIISRLVYYYD